MQVAETHLWAATFEAIAKYPALGAGGGDLEVQARTISVIAGLSDCGHAARRQAVHFDCHFFLYPSMYPPAGRQLKRRRANLCE